ncbi:MAG TPA: BTAD domain-containing putative transcriptional regulator [Nonomuraea sp.]|nr:BTAD domain-containing putative transcriptional regulator [Nonomuraea sp.]
MEFRVLGALEVTAGGRRLELGGTRQQIVLAMLILNAGHSVTIDRIVEAIYDDDPPATSRAQVQICISALRRLFSAYGDAEMIVTTRQGYALRGATGSIDAQRFEALVAKARKARDARGYEQGIDHYREALALWRGSALDGLESRLLTSIARRLHEDHVSAHEDCVQLELELGRHHELVGELTRLVSEHPLREGLLAQLMTALYRSGRQADALQVYREARRRFVDELGIEPSERLQQLEAAILKSDDSLSAPQAPPEPAPQPQAPASVVPRMLPAGIADFIGRQKQIDDINQRLTVPLEGAARFAVPIVAIAGKAGIGKSTIAVHAAHSVAEHFPDGQLFAHLHGAVSRPVSPMQVLDRFLRALGVSGTALPESLDERAEMYRMLLADRTVLVVLDDAASESQVLPLLPGNPDSAVIVTSRSRLGGLAGATQIDVDLFDATQSVDLLARIAGAERVWAEPESAARLAELCCYLPLALRIAGARMAARPHWSVEHLVDRLRDEAHRLDELKHGDLGIRVSLSLTYEAITERARVLFRRLAILDAHSFSAWISAALLAQPLTHAQDLLDELADAQLVEPMTTGPGINVRYRLHDLIRVYARERLAAEEAPAERTAALERVVTSMLRLTEAARIREYGPLASPHTISEVSSPLPADLVERLVDEPIAWFERERPILLAGIRQAAQAGFAELCWRLAMNAESFFELRVYLDDWREAQEVAFEAARASGHQLGQAAMLCMRGSLAQTEQRFDDAWCDYEAALRLFEQTGDLLQIARAMRNLAFLDRMRGRLDEAMTYLERAQAIFTEIGEQVAAAHTLDNIAAILSDCGDLDKARVLLAEALVRANSSGSRRTTSQILHRMGTVHLQAGAFALAAGSFEESLTIVHEIGDSIGESFGLQGLGVARLRQGRLPEADPLLREALTKARNSRHRLAEAHALAGLGELAIAAAKPEEAAGSLREAVNLFREMRMPLFEARTLITLSRIMRERNDDPGADTALSRVLELADRVDDRTARTLREQLSEVHRSRRRAPHPALPEPTV